MSATSGQVLHLERRVRSIETGISSAQGSSSVADGLVQARVTLALKSATHKRQQDIVKAMQAEVSNDSGLRLVKMVG